MDQEKDISEELRELSDASALLLDEKTYTKESRDRLIEAVGLAKVALQSKENDAEKERAYARLCEAVDGLKVAEESRFSVRKLVSGKKKTEKTEQAKPEKRPRGSKPVGNVSWKNAAPYLICGAAIVGSAVFLVGSIAKKSEKASNAKKTHFWNRFFN